METRTLKQELKEIKSNRPSTFWSSLAGIMNYKAYRFLAWILIIVALLCLLTPWMLVRMFVASSEEVTINKAEGVMQACGVCLFVIAFILFYCSKLIRKIVDRNIYIMDLEEFADKAVHAKSHSEKTEKIT